MFVDRLVNNIAADDISKSLDEGPLAFVSRTKESDYILKKAIKHKVKFASYDYSRPAVDVLVERCKDERELHEVLSLPWKVTMSFVDAIEARTEICFANQNRIKELVENSAETRGTNIIFS
jgi:hypothetical protein